MSANNEFTARWASQHGLKVNEHGRVYLSGSSMSFGQKVQVAAEYAKAKSDNCGSRPNLSALARRCQVSRGLVRKVEADIVSCGRVIKKGKDVPVGPGSRSMSGLDMFVIMMLYHEEPSRSLKSYVRGLFDSTGKIVHRSTISRFFSDGFAIKGSLCKPTLIPYDKFRPKNLERAMEYLLSISKHDRRRIKFGDEKHLKGAELWCRKTRRNVFTGLVPPVMTNSDFRNTYSIVGFCAIDCRVTPVRYGIGQGNNNAENFAVQVQLGVLSGFFLPYDVIVLDRAVLHTGKGNSILEDWLWDNYRIFLLLLPARTPEWNPIELVWNILVQRLGVFSLRLIKEMGRHSLVQASEIILRNITHAEVDGCYRECGV